MKQEHGGSTHKSHKIDSAGVEKIDSKLEALLMRYDLEDTIYAFRMKYKYDKSRLYSASEGDVQPTAVASHEDRTFDDPRLAKVWDSVKNDRSFTLNDLDDVYSELENHARKLVDFQQLMEHAKEIASNHVGHDTMVEDESITAMKEIAVSLEKDLVRVERRVKEIKQNPFKLVKVRKLWEKALKSPSLIPNELEAIKSELRHFERHIELAKHRNEQLAAQEAEEFHWNDDDVRTARNEQKEHHEKLERKLKKLEHYLDEKIGGTEANHSEL